MTCANRCQAKQDVVINNILTALLNFPTLVISLTRLLIMFELKKNYDPIINVIKLYTFLHKFGQRINQDHYRRENKTKQTVEGISQARQ